MLRRRPHAVGQCFSDIMKRHVSPLGILWKCRFWFNSLGWEPEIPFQQAPWALTLLVPGPHFRIKLVKTLTFFPGRVLWWDLLLATKTCGSSLCRWPWDPAVHQWRIAHPGKDASWPQGRALASVPPAGQRNYRCNGVGLGEGSGTSSTGVV